MTMVKAEIYDIRWHRAILELCLSCERESDERGGRDGRDDTNSRDSRDETNVRDSRDDTSSRYDWNMQPRLYLTDGSVRVPFEMIADPGADDASGGGMRDTGVCSTAARLNLMTAMGRAPLPKGDWTIAAGADTALRYAPDLLEDPDAYTRFFRYGKAKYGYAVWFTVRQAETGDLAAHQAAAEDLDSQRQRPAAEDPDSQRPTAGDLTGRHPEAGGLSVGLHVDFYVRNPKPQVRKRSLRFLEKKLFRAAYRLIRLFVRRRERRILFFKQNAQAPTENMEALIRRIKERSLDETYELAYRCRNVFASRQHIGAWLKDMVMIAGSKYIFVDDYAPIFDFIDLDEDAVLTQLWHAGVGFKSVGYARFGLDGSPDPFSSSHRHYTYALVGNAALRDIYAEVFGIEREALLSTGMPRLDHFLDEETAAAARTDLYGRYPQLEGKRIILFAPTYRGTGQRMAYYPYEMLDNAALHALCEETDSIFIYEMHHYITQLPQIPQGFRGRILDLSAERLSDLFHIADVLITDYSSCFYDYLLLKKPVILYVPDKTEYVAMHGVQRSIEEMAPGEICETFEALADTLRTRHYESVPPKALTIDRAAERSGLASDRVIDTILLGKDVPGVKEGF